MSIGEGPMMADAIYPVYPKTTKGERNKVVSPLLARGEGRNSQRQEDGFPMPKLSILL